MEGLLLLLVIGAVIYFIYYDHIYKRTKGYKEKQVLRLVQEADQLLAKYTPALETIQTFLDGVTTRKEQLRYVKEFEEKDDEEKAALMKKLIQPKESNMTNKATTQRILLIFDKFQKTKLNYIRLMERLKHGSIDDRLEATQDWNNYVKLFTDEASADPNNFSQLLVIFEEIEKRFDDRLVSSGK